MFFDRFTFHLVALPLVAACQIQAPVTVASPDVAKAPPIEEPTPVPSPTPSESAAAPVERPKAFFEDLEPTATLTKATHPQAPFTGYDAATFFSGITSAIVVPFRDTTASWALILETPVGRRMMLVPPPELWTDKAPTAHGERNWAADFAVTSSLIQVRTVGGRYEIVVCWNDLNRNIVDGRSPPLDIVFYERP